MNNERHGQIYTVATISNISLQEIQAEEIDLPYNVGFLNRIASVLVD